MAVAEIIGLVVGVIVALATYPITTIGRRIRPIGGFVIVPSPKQQPEATYRGPSTGPSEKPLQARTQPREEGEFYFQLDKIFTLNMKPKSSARLFQIGMLVVLFAIAFLIVTYGLKNLGL